MPEVAIRATFMIPAELIDQDPDDVIEESLDYDASFEFNGLQIDDEENYVVDFDEDSEEFRLFSYFTHPIEISEPRGSKAALAKLAELLEQIQAGKATLFIEDQEIESSAIHLIHTGMKMDHFEVAEPYSKQLAQYRKFVDENLLYPEDRLRMAVDASTSPEILALLALDKDFYIRYAVAKNKNTPAATLEMIADNLDREDWLPEEYINEESPSWSLKLDPDYIYDDFNQWFEYVNDINDEIRDVIAKR